MGKESLLVKDTTSLVTGLGESVWRVSKHDTRSFMTLLHHPWVCIYPKGFTSTQHRGICTSALIASLVTTQSFGTNLRVQHRNQVKETA